MAALKFSEFFAKARESATYWAEQATIDFTAALAERMKELRMSRAQLANRLGTSQAYVTKALSGNTNFTIKSMAALAHALGQRVTIQLEPQEQAHNQIVTEAIASLAASTGLRVISKVSSIELHGHTSSLTEAMNENDFAEAA